MVNLILMHVHRCRDKSLNQIRGMEIKTIVMLLLLRDNYGVKVEYDRGGMYRIGNISINFDSNDRVRRIGSVQMSYNRFALERVGGLEIIYNRRGQVVDIFGL
jgi:hypothetical protein